LLDSQPENSAKNILELSAAQKSGLSPKFHALKSPTARFYPPVLVFGAGTIKKRL
jgi:hypothetical protein